MPSYEVPITPDKRISKSALIVTAARTANKDPEGKRHCRRAVELYALARECDYSHAESIYLATVGLQVAAELEDEGWTVTDE